MNDCGGLAAIIIGQRVTILLLALILWRIWKRLADPYSNFLNNLFASS
jgi:hypothetical protein